MRMFLLIDKPEGWSSHDVVGYVRLCIKNGDISVEHPSHIKRIRVGHAGTLDPFATGLLIIGIGREATKQLDTITSLPKVYEATLRLGAISSTQDKTGEIAIQHYGTAPSEDMIHKVLQKFLGKQKQTPPMFSAKKVGGKKLYELARKGKVVPREPVDIRIRSLEILSYTSPSLSIRISCSSGTYIRTLCHDIGVALGTGAYCEALRRTQIGTYRVEQALKPEEIKRTQPKKTVQ